MILFFEDGRLGNQLFQYVGIKKYFPSHKIVLFGFDDLDKVIEPIDAVLFTKKQLSGWLRFGVLRRVMVLLASIRLIGSVEEYKNSSVFSVAIHRGVIPAIYLLKKSYFQHYQIVGEIPNNIRINPNLIKQAKNWLHKQEINGERRALVFVHIRRGDYLQWPSAVYPAVLDLEWYRRAMGQIRDQIANPAFLVCTDDIYYVRDIFGQDPEVIISKNDLGIDLALMSLCQHGILSASSFAWWGAWFSRQNFADNEQCLYFAPNCWAGYRRKQWYPEGFKADLLTYIE